MKNLIDDRSFISGVKEKLPVWIGEQLKGRPAFLPEIEILEVSEYPLYRVVMKAVVETRKISQFRKTGEALARGAQPPARADEIDVWAVEAEGSCDIDGDKKIVEVASTLESSQCKKCKGTGKLTCPDCQGQKTVYCLTCHGDCSVVCSKCRRTLKVDCLACEGRGKVFSTVKQAYEDCSQCDGKGSFPCKDCQNGYNPCSACGGQGRIPCQNCSQTGELECGACAGKGNFISGYRVEISITPLEERLDIPNPDIPESVMSSELPAASYSVERTVNLDAGAGAGALPAELSKQIEGLQRKISVPPGGKIKRRVATFERKNVYRMKYKISGKERAAWFLVTGGRIICDKSLVKEVCAAVISGLNLRLKAGDTAGAQQIIKSIENITAFRAETEKIRKGLDSGVLPSYLTGGVLGAAAASAGIFAFERHFWHASYNLPTVIVFSLLGAAAVSSVAVLLLGIIKPGFLNTRLKRITAGTLLSIAATTCVCFAAAALNINPARALDTKQMQEEYNAYFPYGLRTFATRQDVEFLEQLVGKYEPTGADVSSVKKDLGWLKEKQVSDESAMKKIEKSARDIEQVSADRLQQQKRTYRHARKIYVK